MRTMTDVQRLRATKRIRALLKYETTRALLNLWAQPHCAETAYAAASALLRARRALGVGVES